MLTTYLKSLIVSWTITAKNENCFIGLNVIRISSLVKIQSLIGEIRFTVVTKYLRILKLHWNRVSGWKNTKSLTMNNLNQNPHIFGIMVAYFRLLCMFVGPHVWTLFVSLFASISMRFILITKSVLALRNTRYSNCEFKLESVLQIARVEFLSPTRII